MTDKVLVVVGAGPGTGAAVARRFGHEGYAVSLLARDEHRLARLASDLEADGIAVDWAAVDITDRAALTESLERLGRRHGRVDVLHFNPSVFRMADPLRLEPGELLADLEVGAAALLTAVQAARPTMPQGARVLATGSMAADQPWHEACSLGVQKAALRNLMLSLDRSLAPEGIRAAILTVNGTLAPDTPFAPERVAEALLATATTPDDRWVAEVAYDG